MLNKPELLQAALFGYQEQQREIGVKIAEIEQTLKGKRREESVATSQRPKHQLSAKGRKSLAAAMKKRWAAAKKAGANSLS